MFVGKARRLPQKRKLKGCFTQVGSGVTTKDCTRLQSASLLRTFVIYGSKEFKTLANGVNEIKVFYLLYRVGIIS